MRTKDRHKMTSYFFPVPNLVTLSSNSCSGTKVVFLGGCRVFFENTLTFDTTIIHPLCASTYQVPVTSTVPFAVTVAVSVFLPNPAGFTALRRTSYSPGSRVKVFGLDESV